MKRSLYPYLLKERCNRYHQPINQVKGKALDYMQEMKEGSARVDKALLTSLSSHVKRELQTGLPDVGNDCLPHSQSSFSRQISTDLGTMTVHSKREDTGATCGSSVQ